MTSNTDQEDQELARIPYEAMYVTGINHFKPGRAILCLSSKYVLIGKVILKKL